MSTRTASSAHHRLLIIAIVFALAYAWGPIFATAQTPDCPLEDVCLDLDPEGEEESDPPEEEEESDPPAEEEESDPPEGEEGEEGGLLPDPEEVLDPITEPVEEIVPELPDPVSTPVEDLEETVEKTIEKVTKPLTDTIEETVDDLLGSAPPPAKGPSGGPPAPPPDAGNEEPAPRAPLLLARSLAHELATGPETGSALDVQEIATQPASGNSAAETGLAERVAEVITEVARKLAFPLALALIVGGFLLVQNRLDRRDPKLAAAPKDPDDQFLSFE